MDCKPILQLVPTPAEAALNQIASQSQADHEPRLPDLEPEFDISRIHEKRRDAKKRQKVQTAIQSSSLSETVQEKFLGLILSKGWGRLPHGVVRMLKCPRRYGLKLADVTLIMTVYDSTLAQVEQVMFAPLSAEDFADHTGMDVRDVRRALSGLQKSGVLLRLSFEGINFWGLNPHFFLKDLNGNGKQPLGNLPRGNAPSDKSGESPRVSPGDLTQGNCESTVQNDSEIPTPQNPLQESKKESLLNGSEFPADMISRWSAMVARGQEPKADKEREIFKTLHAIHKQEFFNSCGQVVAFLEKEGSLKNGKKQVIHSPMVWIQDHWQTNLAKFEAWKSNLREKQEKAAKQLDQAAQAAARAFEEEKANEALRTQWNAVADRFLSAYTDESAIQLFVQEAVMLSNNSFAKGFSSRLGWNSPLVRQTVLEHFSKVESGERTTQVPPSKP